MNALVAHLLNCGYVGSDSAITRTELAAAIGISVRAVKHLAEQARLDEYERETVCYSTSAIGGGIYLAADDGEVEAAEAKLRRLALSILRERSALRRKLRRRREAAVQGRLF